MIKKIVIKSSDLPDIISGQTDVFIRYRIVSEDKNRVSAWTPIFSITPTVAYVNSVTQITNDIQSIQSDVSNINTTVNNNNININSKVDDNFAINVML